MTTTNTETTETTETISHLPADFVPSGNGPTNEQAKAVDDARNAWQKLHVEQRALSRRMRHLYGQISRNRTIVRTSAKATTIENAKDRVRALQEQVAALRTEQEALSVKSRAAIEVWAQAGDIYRAELEAHMQANDL